MGINYEGARMLCDAARQGVSFTSTITLGRQYSYLSPKHGAKLAQLLGVRVPPSFFESGDYIDSFLQVFLHAAQVESVDASGYEGATIAHDLNEPIPAKLEQAFDVVIDGGTLEHVFNFPAALANCMKMLRVGGRLFMFTNANNFMGHGFYQFSPELFYRALCKQRGFEVERMMAIEYKFIAAEFGSLRPWYSVADPGSVNGRVMVTNRHPLGLNIQAVKRAHLSEPWREWPQQSDYIVAWAGETDEAQTSSAKPKRHRAMLKHFLRSYLPPEMWAHLKRFKAYLHNQHYQRRVHTLKNRRHFSPSKTTAQ